MFKLIVRIQRLS